MSKHLTHTQQTQVFKHYKEMTVWDMSVAFDIDEIKLRVFMQDVRLEAKEGIIQKARTGKYVPLPKPGPEKVVIERPPAVYSNRSQQDVINYYLNKE